MNWFYIFAGVILGSGIVSALIYNRVNRVIGVCLSGISGWIMFYIISYPMIILYTLYLTYFPYPTGLEDVKAIVNFSAYVLFFFPIIGYVSGVTGYILYLRKKDRRSAQNIDA
jgi:hypothetical protein